MTEKVIIKENDPNRRQSPFGMDQEPEPDNITTTEKLKDPKMTGKPLRKADPYILGIYLLLIVFSIIEIFSASSSEVRADNIYGPLKRHAIFLLLGGVLVFLIQKMHYIRLKSWAYIMGIGSFILLVYASFFGANINGAQRAIMIAGFTIQPAEIVKFTVVILLARILGYSQQEGGVSNLGVIKVAVIVVLFSAVIWVNGLTNMILLMGVSMAMFLIGGIQFRKFAMVLVAYAACGGVLYFVKYQDKSHSEFDQVEMAMVQNGTLDASEQRAGERGAGRMDTHKSRMAGFFKGVSPTDTITDDNRQVWFANMAQAHGGLIGRGPGNSRESARLPLAFSDYIYSIIIEDTGFVGGTILLILYLCLLGRAGVIAYRVRKAFPAFLIMGCAVMIVFQALVHMAIVTGVFPVSGQPLPFISKGGTSILVMSAAIGVMLSVSRFALYRKEDISERPSRRQRRTEELELANS